MNWYMTILREEILEVTGRDKIIPCLGYTSSRSRTTKSMSVQMAEPLIRLVGS
jgi:hypothetical protein